MRARGLQLRTHATRNTTGVVGGVHRSQCHSRAVPRMNMLYVPCVHILTHTLNRNARRARVLSLSMVCFCFVCVAFFPPASARKQLTTFSINYDYSSLATSSRRRGLLRCIYLPHTHAGTQARTHARACIFIAAPPTALPCPRDDDGHTKRAHTAEICASPRQKRPPLRDDRTIAPRLKCARVIRR